MVTKKVLNRKGKYLSLILRHEPDQAGITLDSGGWTDVGALLLAIKLSLPELEEIVEADEKGRFEFSDDRTKLRASQGHSVEVDLGYEIGLPPQYLYHGTSRNNFAGIRDNGLMKMDRHDVHMFDNHQQALEVATKRRPNPAVLKIAAQEMATNGYQFKLSTNNVWLTEIVPPRYLWVDESLLVSIDI
jgi:putative RNA 2'-phosphotransferase